MSSRRPRGRAGEAPRAPVTVEIGGEKHVLRSDVPPEYTRAVAAHVDDTLRALPAYGTLEPFRAATLAALSITDELFRAREELRQLRDELARRTGEVSAVLEAALDAAGEPRVHRPDVTPPASTSPSASRFDSASPDTDESED